MPWQRRATRDRSALAGDNRTERVELPTKDPLSCVEVMFEYQNDSARNTEHIVDAIDTISIVGDGADRIFTMRARELFLLNWLWFGRVPSGLFSEDPGDTPFVQLKIPFGRFIGDPDVWLPLDRWARVELQVQYSPTIAAGGFVTNTGVLSVAEWVHKDGRPAGVHRGYFRTTEFRQFTTIASGEEEFEVPQKHPITMLAVAVREDGIEDGVDVTRVTLDLDSGADIRYRGRFLEIQDENAVMFRVDPRYDAILFLSDTDTALVTCSRMVQAILAQQEGHDIAGDQAFLQLISAIAGNQITLDAAIGDFTAGAEDLTADTTDRRYRFSGRGQGVPFLAAIPLIPGGDLDLALNPRDFDSVDLTIDQGGAGADVRALMQELVP